MWPEQRDTCIQNIISIQNGTVAGKRPSSADTKKEYPVPIMNGKCKVPDEITGYKRWKVYLVGEKAGYRITTNEVEVYQS